MISVFINEEDGFILHKLITGILQEQFDEDLHSLFRPICISLDKMLFSILNISQL